MLTVPPHLISTSITTNLIRLMNEMTTLLCEVVAKPNVDLTWSRSLNLTLNKYNMSTSVVTGKYIYDLSYVFHSTIQFLPSPVYKCQNVNEFDGKYTCEGKWNKDVISYSFIDYNVTTECKFNFHAQLFA